MDISIPFVGQVQSLPAPEVPAETHELSFDNVQADAAMPLPSYAYLETASSGSCDDEDFLNIDLVLNVDGVKIIKKIKICKRALAQQAAAAKAQVTVIESDDPAVTDLEDALFEEQLRIRKMAGLQESAGNKKFNVLFSYKDKDGSRCSSTVKIDAVKDAAHARHVFAAKVASKYDDAKITRTSEVKE